VDKRGAVQPGRDPGVRHEREDDSRVSAQLLVLSACVASSAGVAFDLLKASDVSGIHKISYIVVAVVTVVLSWAVVHTVFTLRYAHEYYSAPVGGIDFKSGREFTPSYLDFAYVAFGVGVTYQIADTDIQRHEIRRTVLGHSLLSYLFGAVILAITINIVGSLLQIDSRRLQGTPVFRGRLGEAEQPHPPRHPCRLSQASQRGSRVHVAVSRIRSSSTQISGSGGTGTAPSFAVSGRSVSSAQSTGSATAARICSSAAQSKR
jgi:hypothetical protein